MMLITIPNNNIKERKYIIDIIFNEFLGLNYSLEINDNCKNWEIEIENTSVLIVEDHFFGKYESNLEYLRLENIPAKIKFFKNDFTPENDIPIIYGNPTLKIENKTLIRCGVDIFASCFFMLTRWEEYVNRNRDRHDRFLGVDSLAFKNDFLNRPIVNEYTEMLKNMLLYLNKSLIFKKHNFKYILTHDVDHIEKWNTPKKIIRHLLGDLMQRRSLIEFFRSILYIIKVKINIKNDPYNTFDLLMDISDKLGVKSYFFFMAKGLTKFDNRYQPRDKKVIQLVNKIKDRNHFIGIHPTYNAYNNFEQLKKELNELENSFNTNISFGREHYLRFEIPTTWQIWDDNNFLWDSTCGFADNEGFRCGVCYEYSVFNILTRKKLRLKEKPLIVMDGSLKTQCGMSPTLMKKRILELVKKTKKYNGEFVFLWHNSSFNVEEWRDYQRIYNEVLF